MAAREKKELTDEEVQFLASLPISERQVWALLIFALPILVVATLGVIGVL